MARRFLEERLQEVRAGVYRRPVAVVEEEGDRDPIFREFATTWLAGKRAALSRGSYEDYESLLETHLFPFFADVPLSKITFDLLLRYRSERAATIEALRTAAEAGQPLTHVTEAGDEIPRPVFGPSQFNRALALLSQILRRAAKSESYDVRRNVAEDRELRLRVNKSPARRHLEADEVVALLAAALELDEEPWIARSKLADAVRDSRDNLNLTWAETARRIDRSATTAMALYQWRVPAVVPRPRRAAIAVLALTGLRNQEAASRQWQNVDFDHARIVLDVSKSQAREIEMSPFLVEELLLHRQSLTQRPEPERLVLASRTGGQRDRQNLNRTILDPAVQRAATNRRAHGQSPLPPAITPHTLRRTFVTMNAQFGRSLAWIVHQTGHTDFATTQRFYLQATNGETQPFIRRCLELLFGTRPIVSLDDMETLLRDHHLTSFLGNRESS